MKNFAFLFYCLLFCCSPYIQGQLKINEFMASNASWKYDPDYFNYSSWIEIYNSGTAPANIGGYYLSDNPLFPKKWTFPVGTTIPANGFLLVWADKENKGLHTNFRLDGKGEFLGLYNASGQVIDSVYFFKQYFNTSMGRFPNGGSQWFYYAAPTCGSSNATQGYLKVSSAPLFSKTGGIFKSAVKVGLYSYSSAAKIYYTTNGSEPNEKSFLYTDSIQIDTTTVIRARSYDTGAVPSSIVTQSFFINVKKTLPIISIGMDPKFLWNDSIGIYVKGVNGIPGPYNEAKSNYYRSWERAANLEMLTTDGTQAFNIGAGISISGNYTRALPEKSFEVKFNSKYGAKKLNYSLFKSKPHVKDFYNIFLRNSGNDWKYTASKWRGTMFKDALIHTLTIGQMDVDYQAYQPAVIYINGQYRGILNIREKLNEDYVGENYKEIDRDSVDIIKHIAVDPWQVTAGDTTRYNRFLEYLKTHDLSKKEVYEYVKTQMDVRNFINYQIIETYVCNTDWPGNNQKIWRPRYGSYKWRWMLYDTDPGMASTLMSTADVDMIGASVGGWNGWWSTVVADNLFKNQNFKDEYAQTYAAHINTTFVPERVVGIVDSLKKNIEAEMPYHINFWKSTPEAIPSMSQWQIDINITKDFAFRRNALNWPYLKTRVARTNMANVSLTIAPAGAGTAYIMGARVNGSSLNGPFFNMIPIEFNVKPNVGHVFSHWEIINNNQKYSRTTPLLTDTLEGDYTIIAHFDGTALKNIEKTSFALFPNPGSDQLTLQNDGLNGIMDIAVIGLDGKIYYREHLNFNQITIIPVTDLKSGIYFLRITTGTSNEIIKFIKY